MKIILVSDIYGTVGVSPCLGHELHWTRCILIDLLCKKLVTTEDIIVTINDRKVFYDGIFKNTLNVQEYEQLDKSKYETLDLRPYLSTFTRYTINQLVELGYSIDSEYKTPEFCQLASIFGFYPQSVLDKFIQEFYIIIHHRYNRQFKKNIIIYTKDEL